MVHLSASNTIHVVQLGEMADHTGLEVDSATCLAINHALNCLANVTNNACLCSGKRKFPGLNFLDWNVKKLCQF